MTRRLTSYMRRTHVRAYERLRAWRRNESGFTAVEFAMVAMPFLMLVFGILSVSLYFFTNFTMENAVWQASRVIRTGQFQLGAGGYTGLSMDDRKKAFKAALCAKAPQFIDCNKAIILVQSNSGGFGSITQPTCATDGAMIEEKDAKFEAGTASSVVLVTVCYPWSFGGNLPFIKLGNLSDGSLLIQASVAFRTEPFPQQN
jgi:Flp pilus assembly protein TadG